MSDARCMGGLSNKWCAPMEAALDPDGAPAKGLSIETLYKLRGPDGPKPVFHMVAYRAKARGKPTMLNMCPWCGESLRPDYKRIKPAAEHTTDQPHE